jgi:GNAT superfamily N-acetyltransferase
MSLVLMSMVTRECWRNQGAARQLIQWGMERAQEDGVPAFLEASTAGKPVYTGAGFQEIGEAVPWDMRPYGVDVVFPVAKMAYYPESYTGPRPDPST